jgi:hypothetical protein
MAMRGAAHGKMTPGGDAISVIQGAHGKRLFSQYSLLTMFSSTKNQLKVASACNFLYSHLNNKIFSWKIAHP